jgi:hypothetical protein
MRRSQQRFAINSKNWQKTSQETIKEFRHADEGDKRDE